MIVAVLALCAGLVGMHQLSMNHMLISDADTTGQAPSDRYALETEPTTAADGTSTAEVHPMGASDRGFVHRSGAGDGECTEGCHSGSISECLLVLSLAMVALWLGRPLRLLTRLTHRPPLAIRARAVGRTWRPALSLVELSLRRT